MKKHSAPVFFVSLLSLLFTAKSYSQVTGQVLDSTAQALPFCNVLLMRAADSSVVTGTSADTSGNFSLERKDTGTFRIRILYAGYRPYYSEPFPLSAAQPGYNAGRIVLHSDPHLLKDVVISAERPFVEQKVDRTVYNIDNSVIAAGNNALELLRKLPGITVDNNEYIQVNGKAGVLVMFDGRMSNLSGQDLAAYLKTIDASQVQRIEVITNPSSKYDAAGKAIINIVLKKDQRLGVNGQVSAGYWQGVYGGGNVHGRINYRMKKWNLFANANEGYGQWYDETDRSTTLDVGLSNTNYQHSYSENNWTYLRAGIDFMPTPKHTLSLVAEGSNASNHQSRNTLLSMYDQAQTLDSSFSTDSRQRNDMRWRSLNLNYQFQIDTNGRELDANFVFAPFSVATTRSNLNTYYDYINPVNPSPDTFKMILPSSVNIWAGQIDYVHPMGTKRKFEAGVKTSYVSTDNNSQYWNLVNGTEIPDTTMSNHFIYTETISAAYLNFAQELNKKFSVQVGVRGEETQSKGTLLTTDTSSARQYFNLFPTAFFSWNVDSSNALNLSYTRRIDRPDYGELNPFRFYTTPYSYFTGNPFLRPQFTDNLELKYIFKGFLNVSASYVHMTDVFVYTPHLVGSTGTFYSRNENLGKYNSAVFSASLSYPLTNWWSTVTSVGCFYDHYFGPVDDVSFSSEGWTWQLNTLNIFTLTKTTTAEISSYYRSPNRNAVWLETSPATLDAGIRQRFAHGKGTVSANISDIFWHSYRNTATYPGMKTVQTGRFDSRRFRISVSWRFGSSKYQHEEHRKSGEDELNRAQ